MTADLDKQERMYLLREGHFLGFGIGLLLSRWVWAALAWGAVLLILWSWSLWRVRPSEGPHIGSTVGGDDDR